MSLPRLFLPWEDEFRRQLSAQVGRGRLELSAQSERDGRRTPPQSPSTVTWLGPTAGRSANCKKNSVLTPRSTCGWLASRPELFQVSVQPQLSQTELGAAKKKRLTEPCVALERQRSREGRFLRRELRGRLQTLSRFGRAAARRSGRSQTAARRRLAERVQTFLAGTQLDQSRLLQEVVAATQKSDITEELVRLQSHVETMTDLIASHEPVGKRLDFLLQEINREVNTVGAKADDAPLRHLVRRSQRGGRKIARTSAECRVTVCRVRLTVSASPDRGCFFCSRLLPERAKPRWPSGCWIG